ncbi:MAG: L-threonylcarbamoyladenylate synthase, partial [Oscillospiraceae bacterium]|nr:L-threonylcarbamoyladenylate synthase [Oscillospiraceae bacterium]
MKTKIIRIDEKNADAPGELEKLRAAAEIIKAGGLVVFPTETVYGLGANALDGAAVQKIYEAKGRPSDNPLIVHVSDPSDICKYAEVTNTAERIIEEFLPAPLTLVLKKKGPELDACCPLETIALRAPKNNAARKLIGLAGVPVAAPSANLSGKPSHTEPEYIIKDMDGRADMIICGENCEIGL